MSDRLSLTRELVEELLCQGGWKLPSGRSIGPSSSGCFSTASALGEAYAEKTHTIPRLLKMIFGAKTEKAEKVLPRFSQEAKVKGLLPESRKTVPHPTREKR